ncbi:type II toxin-antitoxin system RelE/ParE family toxin [Escherichia coli]|uniref:type II toxin-antitoxin system RelE/ParE family toxin n=2 Tax=Escherichia coli TaxID=562 RepID=UPI002380F29A|nr:type II toxin-antitoxin system RelE/ParE family toxin [Escherichia coli]
MELKWTSKALSDLSRLYDFLVLASKPAAARTVQSLTQAPVILLTHPRMGELLFQFEPREVRRIFAGEYEIRYEINGQTIPSAFSTTFARPPFLLPGEGLALRSVFPILR